MENSALSFTNDSNFLDIEGYATYTRILCICHSGFLQTLVSLHTQWTRVTTTKYCNQGRCSMTPMTYLFPGTFTLMRHDFLPGLSKYDLSITNGLIPSSAMMCSLDVYGRKQWQRVCRPGKVLLLCIWCIGRLCRVTSYIYYIPSNEEKELRSRNKGRRLWRVEIATIFSLGENNACCI